MRWIIDGVDDLNRVAKEFLYHLPYGTVPMEIETQRIVSKLDENGGTIELVYTLTVQGEKYFNDMKITVSKR